MHLDVDSTQHVHVPITATDPTGASVDPTADTVELGFLLKGADVDSTVWNDATWETGPNGPVATVLVGPAGAVTLDAGLYRVRFRVTTDVEHPAITAGWLTVEE